MSHFSAKALESASDRVVDVQGEESDVDADDEDATSEQESRKNR